MYLNQLSAVFSQFSIIIYPENHFDSKTVIEVLELFTMVTQKLLQGSTIEIIKAYETVSLVVK